MPTLPSGVSFAIDHIGNDAAFANPNALSRLHAIHSAKQPEDLYLALPVIRFAAPENATGPLAAVRIPDDLPAGTVAYYPGLSLLEFFASLSIQDKEAASHWLADKSRVEFLTRQLFWSINQRRGSDCAEQMLYSSRSRPQWSAIVQEVYCPEDFVLSASNLFPDCASDWKHFASDAGFLRIRPTIVAGQSGPQGALSLGNPPSVQEIDAWEASKPAGVWDYWSFLAFVVVPSGEQPSSQLVVFFEKNTFFERPLEVVARIDLSGCEDYEELEQHWGYIIQTLCGRFQSAPINDQIWTIDGVRFGATAPDQ